MPELINWSLKIGLCLRIARHIACGMFQGQPERFRVSGIIRLDDRVMTRRIVHEFHQQRTGTP